MLKILTLLERVLKLCPLSQLKYLFQTEHSRSEVSSDIKINDHTGFLNRLSEKLLRTDKCINHLFFQMQDEDALPRNYFFSGNFFFASAKAANYTHKERKIIV